MNEACTDCHRSFDRTRIVYQKEQAPCDVLFLRLAPTTQEDRSNLVFASPADATLSRALLGSEMRAVQCGYGYMLRCWSEHEPQAEDIMTCAHHLHQEIEKRHPVLVVLLDEATAYEQVVHDLFGVPVLSLRLHTEEANAIAQMNGIFNALPSARKEALRGT